MDGDKRGGANETLTAPLNPFYRKITNPMSKFVTKLGTTRAGERTRIWIEGDRLIAAGFTVGRRFERVWRDDTLTLLSATQAHFDNLPLAERGTVSGKGTKPLIDIAGAKVFSTFGNGTHVAVTYAMGKITIKPAS